ncbi:hypothetical protein G7067_01085 [Leucobacter insecticola]|uniref:AEC family transporter n=1 Tax=Leucobacter insecticola TaxID=2714934 RepID=A0A6G8FFQ6_9MICO|nr:AEC family transporter [Leucobacter insecticola]QIM15326.1 hypothetical protein G7067_01085 [Leucobacter insecticola]
MSSGIPAAFVWLSLGSSSGVFLIVYLVARQKRVRPRSLARNPLPGPLAVASTYGNVGYLGIPVAVSIFGAEAALAASIGQLIHNLLFMVGYPLLSSVENRSSSFQGNYRDLGRTTWRVLKRSLVLNPIVLSVAAGLVVGRLGVQAPEVFSMTIGMFGNAAVPVAMFAVGLTVKSALNAIRSGGIPIVAVGVASAVKLLVLPLATLGLAAVISGDLGPMWVAVAVVMAAMPVSSSASILAFEHDGDARLVSAVTVVTSLCAVFTIPLMIAILR